MAKVKGESFVMPDRSAKYGLFVDNQGTGSVYSSLIIRQGYSGEDEAIISIYRLAGIEGTVVDNGNGELAFTSEESFFSVGEEVQFPFAF